MISKDLLVSKYKNNLNNFNNPNIDFIIDLIYLEYSSFLSIDDVDSHFDNKTIDIKPYNDVLRPVINELFELNKLESLNLSDDENILDDVNDYLRPNQKMAILNTINQGFKSGIHCQIMGSGKSIIFLNTIQTHHNIFENNKIYVIMTEKIDILKKLFFCYNNDIDTYELNKELFKVWKTNNIINMDNFIIVENLLPKSKNFKPIQLHETKPTIYIVNNAFFRNNNYKKINRENINLILVDECHSISGRNNYKMLQYLKYFNGILVPIIGFSATPLREVKNADKQLVDIYSYDDSLNIISNYTLIDGIKDGIILPFKHYIIENKENDIKLEKEKEKENNKKAFYKSIYDKYVMNNDELPYKKGISWSRKITDLRENYKIFNEIINNDYKLFAHYSTIDSETQFNEFCNKNDNSLLFCVNCCKEGSDIKNVDYGLFLDNVKKRSLLVSLQTGGRIMRPDKDKLKQFATIIELVENEEIEVMTIKKLIDYYKTILNLSTDKLLIEEHSNNSKIINDFVELNNDTIFNENTNEIQIKIGNKTCVIKLDLKIIDWCKLKELLNETIKKELGEKKDDEFNKIISKLKLIDNLKKDKDYWLEYDKLNHKILDLPNSNKFRDRYLDRFNDKTWYDLLELKFNYYSYNDLICKIKKRYPHIKSINKSMYDKMIEKDNMIPPYPFEYYRLSGWIDYENLLNDYIDI